MLTIAAPTPDVALTMPHTDAPVVLDVHSPGFEDGQPIPAINSAYAEDIAPEIIWEHIPEGTQSIALLCEDPDAHQAKPFVHWLLYNIAPDARSTRAAVEAQIGTNSKGQTGYYGPCPPAGDPPHHYHFQVFALNTSLPLPNGAESQIFLEAIAGRVLAKGELVGTFAAPPS